jgi:hypothetical protein
VLVGNGNAGSLDGGGGNDTLDGGGGADDIHGGSGIDTVSYAGRSGPVKVDLAVAGGNGEAGENDSLFEIEAVAGGNGDDNIAGDDTVNILSGGPGNDVLTGRGADDQIFGGDGNDTELGSGGADKLSGGDGNDNLRGEADADTLNGDGGDDQLDGGAASDTLTGGPGKDAAVYASRTKSVNVSLDAADNDGESGERDFVRVTTESTKTGAGNDTINARDGVAGDVSCGAGDDSVLADSTDNVASDCEDASVSALSTCTIKPNRVIMKGGAIRVRVSCRRAGKASLRLRTVGRAKRASKLGSKSVQLRAGKRKTVKIKLTGKAKRLLRSHKGSLRAHTTVSFKGGARASRALKRSKNLTIVAPRWRR